MIRLGGIEFEIHSGFSRLLDAMYELDPEGVIEIVDYPAIFENEGVRDAKHALDLMKSADFYGANASEYIHAFWNILSSYTGEKLVLESCHLNLLNVLENLADIIDNAGKFEFLDVPVSLTIQNARRLVEMPPFDVRELVLIGLSLEEHNVINAFASTLERLTIKTTSDLSEVRVLPRLKFLKILDYVRDDNCGSASRVPCKIASLKFCRTSLEELDVSNTHS